MLAQLVLCWLRWPSAGIPSPVMARSPLASVGSVLVSVRFVPVWSGTPSHSLTFIDLTSVLIYMLAIIHDSVMFYMLPESMLACDLHVIALVEHIEQNKGVPRYARSIGGPSHNGIKVDLTRQQPHLCFTPYHFTCEGSRHVLPVASLPVKASRLALPVYL